MTIDKSTMKIFFEGMQGNMLGGGYTSKIIATPMGPFKWNDVTELWENVNNGMVMNNISFQDMMTMGYETLGGGGDSTEIPDRQPVLFGNFGNIAGMTSGPITRWSSINGPQAILLNGSTVEFRDINRPIEIRLSSVVIEGTNKNLLNIYYSINGSAGVTYTLAGFTIANGQNLRIAGRSVNNVLSGEGATGTIFINNFSNGGNTLASITWSYKYSLEGPG